MRTVNFTQLRQNLAAELDSVINDAEEVVVTRSGHEPVVIVPLAEYKSMKETEYLLRSPSNAAALRRWIAELDEGDAAERNLVRPGDRTRRRVRLVFTATAWSQYLSHGSQTVKRINDLIADVMRNEYEGIGKPEPLGVSSPASGPAGSIANTGWCTGSPRTTSRSSPAGTTTATGSHPALRQRRTVQATNGRYSPGAINFSVGKYER